MPQISNLSVVVIFFFVLISMFFLLICFYWSYTGKVGTQKDGPSGLVSGVSVGI